LFHHQGQEGEVLVQGLHAIFSCSSKEGIPARRDNRSDQEEEQQKEKEQDQPVT
jgi:hypothetical protein